MNSALLSVVLPCFNDGVQALAAVRSLECLPRPAGCELEGIVVDDASTDGSAAVLEKGLPAWVRLLRAEANLGRGGAINLGATGGRGSRLLILDSDCLPAAEQFLLAHDAALAAGVDASVGGIVGGGAGFWGRYQSQAAARRETASGAHGATSGMTTANVMIRAEVFRRAGGFDPRYRHYGFEDRDLLLRLQRCGARLEFNPRATARHSSDLGMAGIVGKMRSCGRYSAPLFRAAHPEAYARLGYQAIDAQLHPLRGALLAPFAGVMLSRADSIERVLQRDWVPFSLRAALARLTTALAYCEGTRTAAQG